MYKDVKYDKIKDGADFIITEKGHNYLRPKKAVTFAFDTETFVYFNGEKISQKDMLSKLKGLDFAEKRKAITTNVWAWQVYDEVNGFFMTNNFYKFLYYLCLIGGKFGWCYNAKFDFAQIDYLLLVQDKERWHEHTGDKSKADEWSYSSLHSDMGARYSYKLWVPYKRKGRDQNRHTRVHSVDLRDFMNIMAGGLDRVLKSLDIGVNKLKMDYQKVDPNNLTEDEIEYCCNDVKGLYFAIKKYNETLEELSNHEDTIMGKGTNIMTAGGIAKRALLREIYPKKQPNKRLKTFQKQHPLTVEQDVFLRNNKLYRGGICFVNKAYQGKLLTQKMYRYDVNSEYPFAMSEINDLIGKPKVITYQEWLNYTTTEATKWECVLMLKSVTGELKPNMVATWLNPFTNKYTEVINERHLHLMFEREFLEYQNWYNIEYDCEQVILWKKGKRTYKPFVHKFYELKAQAKKQQNAGLTADSKLKLNSSYGKLAERIERESGYYCLNEETGAVHFVKSEPEIDDSVQMNVAIGALVTAVARVWILSHIRKICGNVAKNFVYIDTDSIHTFCEHAGADAYKLGGLKLEATCCACKYIAPKTYIDIEEMQNNKATKFECHTKGVNVNSIVADFSNNNNIDYIDKRFEYGQTFVCLQAINVIGGKALIPVEKYLARDELRPTQDMAIYNHDGANIEYEI